MLWGYLAPFALVAGYLGAGLTREPGTLPSALLDKPAPNFALPPLLATSLEVGRRCGRSDVSGERALETGDVALRRL